MKKCPDWHTDKKNSAHSLSKQEVTLQSTGKQSFDLDTRAITTVILPYLPSLLLFWLDVVFLLPDFSEALVSAYDLPYEEPDFTPERVNTRVVHIVCNLLYTGVVCSYHVYSTNTKVNVISI